MNGIVNWLRSILRPFGLLRENIKSLIAFEVIFRILTFLVLFPLMTWAQRLWLIANKTKVIAWYNVITFIKNPVTWIIFFFMIVLLVAAAMFEQFALYDTLHASKFGLRRTTRQVFSSGFDMCVERLRLENWGFIPYVIFVLRFGPVSDVSSITSVIRIPGFIIEDFHKHPWEMWDGGGRCKLFHSLQEERCDDKREVYITGPLPRGRMELADHRFLLYWLRSDRRGGVSAVDVGDPGGNGTFSRVLP